MKNIFDFKHYKSYLESALGAGKKKTGRRAEAARAMKCQTAYLSQVMNGHANLSLEQAFSLNEFLRHNADEAEYFLLLVQKERAGTKELERYFQEKLNAISEKRLMIKNRVQAQEGLSPVEQTVYYSRWYYTCIDVMLSIPELQTKGALIERLGLPAKTVNEVLDFLVTHGLAIRDGERFKIGPQHLHLPHDSPHIQKHHTNWRLQALNSLDQPKPDDLHYSVVVTLSKADAVKVKERILEMIQDNMKIISDSKEETAFALTIDFFEK